MDICGRPCYLGSIRPYSPTIQLVSHTGWLEQTVRRLCTLHGGRKGWQDKKESILFQGRNGMRGTGDLGSFSWACLATLASGWWGILNPHLTFNQRI